MQHQRYKTVAVPFQLMGNRQVLTKAQLHEHPWLMEFINRFRHCFEYDAFWEIYIYAPPD